MGTGWELPICSSEMFQRMLVGDTFETTGIKRNSITHDDLSCYSELPESKDGNASGVHEGKCSSNVYEGLSTQKYI